MAQKKVKPFLRGMGAREDFIAEVFAPSDEYKAQQMASVQRLMEAGLDHEVVASLFFVPYDLLSSEKPKKF
jgi:hypothetical protein